MSVFFPSWVMLPCITANAKNRLYVPALYLDPVAWIGPLTLDLVPLVACRCSSPASLLGCTDSIDRSRLYVSRADRIWLCWLMLTLIQFHRTYVILFLSYE